MKEPSRSYARSIPIVTTYEPELEDNNVNKRLSVAGSVRSVSRAPSVMAAGVIPAPVQATPSVRAPSVKAPSVKRAASTKAESYREPVSPVLAQKAPSVRSPSRAGSVKANSIRRQSQQPNGDLQPGSVISPERQREMQNRVSLVDNGARRNDDYNQQQQRSVSPRPTSPFGHRPQPNLMSVIEDGRESRYDGNDRSGVLGRSGTVLSRANTQGRNGTLSRAANGGTVGSRRGAFGRGAGASIGTQPEEVLGRDDIHTRAELSERILDDATLRRLSTMEKKDAARLAKIIKSEGKAEHAAVKGSIKELERLNKLQREAAHAERKSQSRLSKWISKEHRARLRFLKEKERYEKVEGDLRNAENDYEERRDHAAGLTAQVAEKTQELDDLRGQKAADDVSRSGFYTAMTQLTYFVSVNEKLSFLRSRTRLTARSKDGDRCQQTRIPAVIMFEVARRGRYLNRNSAIIHESVELDTRVHVASAQRARANY